MSVPGLLNEDLKDLSNCLNEAEIRVLIRIFKDIEILYKTMEVRNITVFCGMAMHWVYQFIDIY